MMPILLIAEHDNKEVRPFIILRSETTDWQQHGLKIARLMTRQHRFGDSVYQREDVYCLLPKGKKRPPVR